MFGDRDAGVSIGLWGSERKPAKEVKECRAGLGFLELELELELDLEPELDDGRCEPLPGD